MDLNGRRGGILVLVLCVAVGYVLSTISNRVSAYAEDPPTARTGAPGEDTCHGCHASYDINDPSGSVMIGALPNPYVPGGDPVPFTVTVAQDGTNRTRSRWGFELTALDANNLFACDRDRCDDTLAPTDHTTKMDAALPDGNLRFYVKQTTLDGVDGTFESDEVVPSATWMLSFRPPDGDIGPITFYVAGNAANGDGTLGGDYIFVNSFTISSPGGNLAARAGSVTGPFAGRWLRRSPAGQRPTGPYGD
jgi:hypothetical protein